jgi:ankyrin repeat protein
MEPKGYAILGGAADIHAYNDYALHLASQYSHLAIIECLIKNGAAEGWRLLGDADIHSKNNTALQWACYNGHLDIIKCLVSHGAVRATP